MSQNSTKFDRSLINLQLSFPASLHMPLKISIKLSPAFLADDQHPKKLPKYSQIKIRLQAKRKGTSHKMRISSITNHTFILCPPYLSPRDSKYFY